MKTTDSSKVQERKRNRVIIQNEINEVVMARKPFEELLESCRKGTAKYLRALEMNEIFNLRIIDLNREWFKHDGWST